MKKLLEYLHKSKMALGLKRHILRGVVIESIRAAEKRGEKLGLDLPEEKIAEYIVDYFLPINKDVLQPDIICALRLMIDRLRGVI